jgi:hypothetical protein
LTNRDSTTDMNTYTTKEQMLKEHTRLIETHGFRKIPSFRGKSLEDQKLLINNSRQFLGLSPLNDIEPFREISPRPYTTVGEHFL